MKLANRLSVTFALGLMTPMPALAQSSSANAALPGYELGGRISAFFLEDAEGSPPTFNWAWDSLVGGAEATRPPSVWVTLPMGRWGVQIDYLRSVQSQPLYYARYSHTDDQGQEISYDVARKHHHVAQVLEVAFKWPFSRRGRSSYLLMGGAVQRGMTRACVAISPGDRPEHGARVDFPPGFECSRSPGDVSHIGLPVYGVGVDFPLGSRFFASVQYRAWFVPWVGDLRVGAGVRF